MKKSDPRCHPVNGIQPPTPSIQPHPSVDAQVQLSTYPTAAISRRAKALVQPVPLDATSGACVGRDAKLIEEVLGQIETLGSFLHAN